MTPVLESEHCLTMQVTSTSRWQQHNEAKTFRQTLTLTMQKRIPTVVLENVMGFAEVPVGESRSPLDVLTEDLMAVGYLVHPIMVNASPWVDISRPRTESGVSCNTLFENHHTLPGHPVWLAVPGLSAFRNICCSMCGISSTGSVPVPYVCKLFCTCLECKRSRAASTRTCAGTCPLATTRLVNATRSQAP